jgi:phenylacetate-CoA ligase
MRRWQLKAMDHIDTAALAAGRQPTSRRAVSTGRARRAGLRRHPKCPRSSFQRTGSGRRPTLPGTMPDPREAGHLRRLSRSTNSASADISAPGRRLDELRPGRAVRLRPLHASTSQRAAKAIELALELSFGTDRYSTLLINALPMGVRFSCSTVTIAETSVREDMVCALVEQFAPHHQQTILVTDPLFCKRLLDQGRECGLDWGRFKVHVVLGEETFGEAFRIMSCADWARSGRMDGWIGDLVDGRRGARPEPVLRDTRDRSFAAACPSATGGIAPGHRRLAAAASRPCYSSMTRCGSLSR